MTTPETSAGRVAEKVSTWMFLSGILTVGVGGFLLLCLIAYAMVTENLALGVVCGLLLLVPYVCGIVWFFSLGASLSAERVPGETKEVAPVYSDR
jgi:hypothetical protein